MRKYRLPFLPNSTYWYLYSYAIVLILLTKMSNSCRSDIRTPLNAEELSARCRREHRKENGVLESFQSQSIQPIRILEQCEKSLSEAYTEDKRCIQRLEKELVNCSQEIDYLQDQLSARNAEVNYLEEHVRNLELKLEGMEDLQQEVFSLREELKGSNSKQFLLIQELETKEVELEKSALAIEKLEESFSSIGLESQFEVESIKLDMMALEQNLFEAKKIQDETLDENNRMSRLVEELQVALQDAQKTIIFLNEENRELKEKLDTVNIKSRIFSQKDENWLENKDRPQLKKQPSLNEQGSNSIIPEDIRTYGDVQVPLLRRSTVILDPATDLEGKMEMSHQIQEYECLVKKLKEELREEKMKAKEEAEDLVQEMAELRYQFTGLLEEERKCRAKIEHASLQRIAELEAQV
ncbi:protein NETWORKED 1D isoform X2 [Abrus precatorius]|uniref:Protein NETWORKED 1D isoform X2 n=1 Tax=Abrus precatorius TaxID=3816 RepID=A0A8B8JM48_ABRPR|nr:protein NETWORKED 1D isoform X2 [Abrus precatorius]